MFLVVAHISVRSPQNLRNYYDITTPLSGSKFSKNIQFNFQNKIIGQALPETSMEENVVLSHVPRTLNNMHYNMHYVLALSSKVLLLFISCLGTVPGYTT